MRETQPTIDEYMEMYSSLLLAVQAAGGSIATFSWSALKTMTVQDLIVLLSTNKVRFVYKG